MKVAVFGCLHGMLDAMYSAVESEEHTSGIKIDLVIVCGDCQTIRHFDDLKCLAVPNKYKKVGDFHQYYSGQKRIPRLTIFVGGNHEASNYLMSLPYGGWVCDNFYYLGYAGVVRYRGLRIAGVSGIYNYHNCNKGRFERLPLDDQTIRSVYHTRRLDIFRLQLLSRTADSEDPVDVFISHDWPARVYDHGDKEQLMRFKPAFRPDIQSRSGLGSPLTEPLIKQLKPKRWFAAHLHCRFYAKVVHDRAEGRSTEFLSLNKIENAKHLIRNDTGERIKTHMEVLDLVPDREYDDSDDNLYYDIEWLTVLRKTNALDINSRGSISCPRIEDDTGKAYFATKEDIRETEELMERTGDLKIKKNFKMYDPVIYNRPNCLPPSLDTNRVRNYPNPQNDELCSRLLLKKSEKREPKTETVETKPVVNNEVLTIPKVPPKTEEEPPAKKCALSQESAVELDEDGCLPFYIDTTGNQ